VTVIPRLTEGVEGGDPDVAVPVLHTAPSSIPVSQSASPSHTQKLGMQCAGPEDS
jgi:hypothetical protein